MDFRLRADGELFVLEANANPNISAAEDFAQSALTAGMSYDDLLQRIMQLGENYPEAWRAGEPYPRAAPAGRFRAPRGAYELIQRFIQASTVSYHWTLSAGFNTQWFSFGKYRNSLGMPRRCNAVNTERPWESGTR